MIDGPTPHQDRNGDSGDFYASDRRARISPMPMRHRRGFLVLVVLAAVGLLSIGVAVGSGAIR